MDRWGRKDYNGFELGAKKLLNAKECQNWCQEIEKCQMFVYATSNSMCHLKYKMEYELKLKQGFIAGEKYCPPIPAGNVYYCFLY